MLTIRAMSSIIPIARLRNGGIAQLARACGSYPQCPRFESRCRYQTKAQRFSLRLLYGPLVKRLRHRPFTAASRVRIPYASPYYVSLAQLVEHLTLNQQVRSSSLRWDTIFRALSSAGRASALQAECQRFDPVSAHHKTPQVFPALTLAR